MALIGKIRENMWLVFALIAVGVIGFIIQSAQPDGAGGGATGSTAFSINGKKIDVNALQRLESIESNSTGISGNALRSKVYDDLITRTIVEKEAEKLGLKVSEEDTENLLFGSKLSPVIQQLFRDPRTGTVNRENLLDVKTNLEKGDVNPSFMAMWNEKKGQATSLEIQNRISTMVSKGLYTPTWMAEQLMKTNNVVADIDYVKVPFNTIDDASIQLTDADYTAYMNKNKNLFNSKEEGRVVEYVVFDVNATAEDSTALYAEMSTKTASFLNPEQGDSLFALSNGGNYVDFYFKKEDLPENFQEIASTINIGEVHGPIVNDRYYSSMKLVDRKLVADSIKISHIFKPVVRTSTAEVASAIQLLDSLKSVIESGKSSFDSLAIKFSDDTNSAIKGGDLGYVTQGQYFPEINEIAFFTGNLNQLYRVQTDNGIHLIKITERRFTTQDPKFKVAFINQGIEPSATTTNTALNNASTFISENRTIEGFRTNYTKYPNTSLKTSKILNKKDYEFQEFGFDDDARNIVLWAFNRDTKVGAVSPDMFTFRDKTFNFENKLIIAALQAKTPKGNANLADVKNSISDQVLEYAKSLKIAEMMKGKSIEEVTSNMNGATSGNIAGARTSSSFFQDLGYEPKLTAALLSGSQGQMTAPVIGTGGVYMLKINNKQDNSASSNAVSAKRSENLKARQNVNYQLFDALKNGATVKDKRMDFGM